MTTTTVYFMNCDFAGCSAQAPRDSDGWANEVYTHGCPAHAEAIRAHRANITSQTSGRGYKEKTTWFLTCVCGWRPTPFYQSYNTDLLKRGHLAHLAEVS